MDAAVLWRRNPAFRQGRGSLIVIIRPPWKTRSARVGWTKRRATRGRRSYHSANYMFMCPSCGSGFGIDADCKPHRGTPDHLHGHGKTNRSEVVSNRDRLPRPGSSPGGVAQRDRGRDPNTPLSPGRLILGDPANVDRRWGRRRSPARRPPHAKNRLAADLRSLYALLLATHIPADRTRHPSSPPVRPDRITLVQSRLGLTCVPKD